MIRTLLFCCLLLCLAPVAAMAKPASGDTIYIRWAAQVLVGKVVSIEPNGWIKVTCQQNGRPLTVTLPPHKVFSDPQALADEDDAKQKKVLELLRTNSDGKNVSTTEYRVWHGPGKEGRKFGPPLFTARVKGYRAGSKVVLFETRDRKELVVKFEQICNAERGYLAELLRKRKK
jgi:hypothetical protein